MKKIQKILLSTILTILAFSFLSSCASKEKVIYRTKIVYKECPTIDISQRPQPNPYSSVKLMYNNTVYYCLSINDAKILTVNWLEYKEWCESMYMTIKDYNDLMTKEKR